MIVVNSVKTGNGGVSYCCTVNHAVPLLYREELQFLQNKGNNWQEWVPRTREEKALVKSTHKDQVFCSCNSSAKCERELRSISCRTFPLEPYLNRHGKLIGLTFIQDFMEKNPTTGRPRCPLTQIKQDIRQEYIDEAFTFWEKLMERRNEEYRTYLFTSRSHRKEYLNTGTRFHVLLPTHLKDKISLKQML